ncbi:MAG: hypothetical protein KBS66_07175 [Eubacterium sp.]|nr:hypothetical protein [Candidatus Colimonas fimequi]
MRFMSRNKFILLCALAALLYLTLPNEGFGLWYKINLRNFLPFFMAFLITYLFITMFFLKKAWKEMDKNVCDETVIKFSKIMNISFDVKRMLGANNLIDLYHKVNFSSNASMDAKQLLYDAMRRKRLDVPPPGQGTNIDFILKKTNRTDAEIKAARIEASIQAKKKKNKKK